MPLSRSVRRRYLAFLGIPLVLAAVWLVTIGVFRAPRKPVPVLDTDIVNGPREPGRAEVPPRIVKQVPAVYPEELRVLGIDGEVTVSFIVNARGRIEDPRVVARSNPGFVRAALETVQTWTFQPGTKDRRPVAARMEATIVFQIEDEAKRTGLWSVDPPQAWGEQVPENFRFETAPRLLGTRFAVYPREALTQGAGAKVEVGLVIDPAGEIVRMTVLNEDAPAWAILAARAMYGSWKLAPALRQGQPCFAGIRTQLEFSPAGGGTFPLSPSARAVLRELAKPKPAIVEAAALDHPPAVLDREQPAPGAWIPPERARGRVVIEYFVDPKGDVVLPAVVSAPNPELGAFAALTVQSWVFAPPLKDGKPVTARATTPLDY
jgi:TonB family protein